MSNAKHQLHGSRRTFTRLMSKLADVPKTSSFTRDIKPDIVIPNIEFAKENEEILHKPRILKSGGFSWTLPEKRKEYRHLATSENALRDLGLDLSESKNPEFQRIVSGQHVVQKPFPYSQAYAGWQFGQFAGQLGDGRVVNLFEIEGKQNGKRYELQLKGAGKTPYSRFADGKAVLRSSIREFIISEALHSIGIPTSRALSISYLPQTLAQRYRAEKCAIVARFAESWIRLGTFDLYRWRGDRDGIKQLSDYVIKEVFHNDLPGFAKIASDNQGSLGDLTPYDRMYLNIVQLNAKTTAMWQVYGFINGVLNTDNTSIMGLSIDFGPFAIMDKFDPNYTSNSEDHNQRYGYKNTPTAIWWNLTRLGEDLAELIGAGSELLKDETFLTKGIKPEWEDGIIRRATKVIEVAGENYKASFMKQYVESMGKRLGLTNAVEKDHENLFNPLLDVLRKTEIDYNKFFVLLQNQKLDGVSDLGSIADTLVPQTIDNSRNGRSDLLKETGDWLRTFTKRLAEQGVNDSARYSVASKANPIFLPRNWILDDVIEYTESHDGDATYLSKLLRMSSNPYDKSKWGDDAKQLEDKWMGDVGNDLSMLQCSCSS